MVTAKAQYDLRNAERYFGEHLSVGDYYREGQKTWEDWFGRDAETLGLQVQVLANEFLALCDNHRPQTGQTLIQRQQRSFAQTRCSKSQSWPSSPKHAARRS